MLASGITSVLKDSLMDRGDMISSAPGKNPAFFFFEVYSLIRNILRQFHPPLFLPLFFLKEFCSDPVLYGFGLHFLFDALRYNRALRNFQ